MKGLPTMALPASMATEIERKTRERNETAGVILAGKAEGSEY